MLRENIARYIGQKDNLFIKSKKILFFYSFSLTAAGNLGKFKDKKPRMLQFEVVFVISQMCDCRKIHRNESPAPAPRPGARAALQVSLLRLPAAPPAFSGYPYRC